MQSTDFYIPVVNMPATQDGYLGRRKFYNIDYLLEFHSRYADVMSKLLSDEFGYLLVSIERQHEQPNMMPHSVSFDDAQEFFGKISGC